MERKASSSFGREKCIFALFFSETWGRVRKGEEERAGGRNGGDRDNFSQFKANTKWCWKRSMCPASPKLIKAEQIQPNALYSLKVIA